MKIALFSDVHGHLRILLHLIRNWQMAHTELIDLALIAGDLGCFPDESKLDKATKRWIERDPEEAGFSRFFTQPKPEVERLFAPELGPFSAVRCPILFVPGNHDDYSYLAALKGRDPAPGAPPLTFPVDCYSRFHAIADGEIITVSSTTASLRIAGLWGIENTRAGAPYRIDGQLVQKLVRSGPGAFDLLLTHDAPAEAYPLSGASGIAQIIKTCSPAIHLFGHVHPIGNRHEFSLSGLRTRSLIFKDVSFGKEGNLLGSMGILKWSTTGAQVTVVDDEWLAKMRPQTWEQVVPRCCGAR